MPDTNNIIKTIHRLRNHLNELEIANKLNDPKENRQFGERLVENLKYLGYRISLPPENIHLRWLD